MLQGTEGSNPSANVVGAYKLKVGSFLEFWRVNDTFIGIIGYKGTKTVLMDM